MEASAILPALVFSLQKHVEFAAFNKIDVRYPFPEILTQLICTRPLVCVEAMDSNTQFLELAINALHSELINYTNANPSSLDGNSSDSLNSNEIPLVQGEMKIPSLLVQSICVVLSIWNDQTVSDQSEIAVINMADALLYRDDIDADGTRRPFCEDLLGEGRSIISLENVRILLFRRLFSMTYLC